MPVAPPPDVELGAPLDDLPPDEALARLVGHLPGADLTGFEPIGVGRGVFSRVWRVELRREGEDVHLVAKIPAPGANGEAARSSGACHREAWAYTELLWRADVGGRLAPECLLVARDPQGGASFLLEDLSGLRAGDQAAGGSLDDAVAVIDTVARFHRLTALTGLDGPVAVSPGEPVASVSPVRRHAPATFTAEAVRGGLDRLPAFGAEAWSSNFRGLVERRDHLVEAFVAAPEPVLCHGDPRLDNVAFADPDGTGAVRAVLYDFQQLAIQLGEADVAWLAATSLEPDVRAELDAALVETYAEAVGRDTSDSVERYRLGFVLPGLAVLVLAQRVATPDTAPLVARSLSRIGRALGDLDVPGIA